MGARRVRPPHPAGAAIERGGVQSLHPRRSRQLRSVRSGMERLDAAALRAWQSAEARCPQGAITRDRTGYSFAEGDHYTSPARHKRSQSATNLHRTREAVLRSRPPLPSPPHAIISHRTTPRVVRHGLTRGCGPGNLTSTQRVPGRLRIIGPRAASLVRTTRLSQDELGQPVSFQREAGFQYVFKARADAANPSASHPMRSATLSSWRV